MDIRIEPYAPQHRDAVAALSLRAWAPVFESLERALNPEVYKAFYPGDDWRPSQQTAVEAMCDSADSHAWVALDGGAPVGFVAVKLHRADSMGEIAMLAVDPAAQRRGVGAALGAFALEWMKEAGMAIAMVETGGDPGHAPARRAYERMGFELFPVARYFAKL